jgi:hypothetical protein
VHAGGTILRAASVAAVTPRCTAATFAILHAVAHFTAIPAPGLGSTGISPPRIASATQVFPCSAIGVLDAVVEFAPIHALEFRTSALGAATKILARLGGLCVLAGNILVPIGHPTTVLDIMIPVAAADIRAG